MSDQLIVKLGGQIVETVTLDRPMMRIGRGDGCDIKLDDPEKRVSRFHAVIQRSSGREEFKIKNDEGKTGVLVNNNRADDWIVLKRGDLIQIGPFSLIYTYGAAGGEADDVDATMVALDSGEDMTMVGGADFQSAGVQQPQQAAAEPSDVTMAMPGGRSVGGEPLKLIFVKGPFKGGQQTITSPSFTIGRSQEQNAVWLKDDTVSTQHAEVSQAAGKYFVKDLGSQNGLSVNGKKVIGESDLKNGDKITIGLSTFKVNIGGGGGGGGSAVKILASLVGILVLAAAAYFGYQAISGGGPGAGSGGGDKIVDVPDEDKPDGGTGPVQTPPVVAVPATPPVTTPAVENDEAKRLREEIAALKAEKEQAEQMEKAKAELAAQKMKLEQEAKMRADEQARMAAAEAAKLAATPDPVVAVTPDPVVAVTPDPVVAVTPDPVVAVTPDPVVAVTPDPVVAATPAVVPEAAAAGSAFKLGPVDPARKITPAAAIEYKSY